jgi:hypothetical protein
MQPHHRLLARLVGIARPRFSFALPAACASSRSRALISARHWRRSSMVASDNGWRMPCGVAVSLITAASVIFTACRMRSSVESWRFAHQMSDHMRIKFR